MKTKYVSNCCLSNVRLDKRIKTRNKYICEHCENFCETIEQFVEKDQLMEDELVLLAEAEQRGYDRCKKECNSGKRMYETGLKDGAEKEKKRIIEILSDKNMLKKL